MSVDSKILPLVGLNPLMVSYSYRSQDAVSLEISSSPSSVDAQREELRTNSDSRSRRSNACKCTFDRTGIVLKGKRLDKRSVHLLRACESPFFPVTQSSIDATKEGRGEQDKKGVDSGLTGNCVTGSIGGRTVEQKSTSDVVLSDLWNSSSIKALPMPDDRGKTIKVNSIASPCS